jgi:hypothetical protein
MKTFYHRGSKGDIIYSLCSLKYFEKSNFVFKNKHYFDFFYRLFVKQNYINNIFYLDDGKILWKDIDINLDEFRKIHKKDVSKPLVKCFEELLNIKTDPSLPWIENISSKKSNLILINRTTRYHDKENINWNLLKKYENYCFFIGDEKEYNIFKNLTKLNIEYIVTKDALDCCEIIKGCNLFIGNQSFCYSLAEALKVERVLEVYYEKPNCGPFSNNGYTSENLQLKLNKLFS